MFRTKNWLIYHPVDANLSMTPYRYRLLPCQFFFHSGKCKNGDNCLFSHGRIPPMLKSPQVDYRSVNTLAVGVKNAHLRSPPTNTTKTAPSHKCKEKSEQKKDNSTSSEETQVEGAGGGRPSTPVREQSVEIQVSPQTMVDINWPMLPGCNSNEGNTDASKKSTVVRTWANKVKWGRPHVPSSLPVDSTPATTAKYSATTSGNGEDLNSASDVRVEDDIPRGNEDEQIVSRPCYSTVVKSNYVNTL